MAETLQKLYIKFSVVTSFFQSFDENVGSKLEKFSLIIYRRLNSKLFDAKKGDFLKPPYVFFAAARTFSHGLIYVVQDYTDNDYETTCNDYPDYKNVISKYGDILQ